jgi:hypothetical protein
VIAEKVFPTKVVGLAVEAHAIAESNITPKRRSLTHDGDLSFFNPLIF